MRNRIVLLFILLITGSLSLNLKAQSQSAELSRITDNLTRSVKEQMPGWTHTSVTPIEGGRDVTIDQWSSEDKTVRVIIISYASSQEAVRRLQEFVRDVKAEQQATDVGEEEYSWDTRGSTVFRKRNITVTIHVNEQALKDDKKPSKQFARLVADALDTP